MSAARVMVRNRRYWWVAFNPDENIAVGHEGYRYFRARTRERAVEKCMRHFSPKESS